MSIKNFETAILGELRRQPGCALLKMKDILEWNTAEHGVTVRDGERMLHLPENGVYVVFKHDASQPTGASRR